jgi:hypothetical protein
MALKVLSDYAGPNFTDPGHPGFGHPYLILNGPQGNGQFDFEATVASTSHRVTFCVPWEGLGAFVQFCLMGVAASGGTFVRTLPLESPYASIFPNTFASRVSGKGDGSDTSVTDARLFADCILTVQFETLQYALEGGGAFIEINYGGSADYDTFPSAQLQFSGGEKIDHDAGVLVGQESIQVTAHNVPDPAAFLAVVNPLKGKVNSVALVIDGWTYPIGTILFPTFDLDKAVVALGNITAEATIQLLQRDLPWNQGIRSDGVVDDIIVTGTTTQPYVTADLTPLLG